LLRSRGFFRCPSLGLTCGRLSGKRARRRRTFLIRLGLAEPARTGSRGQGDSVLTLSHSRGLRCRLWLRGHGTGQVLAADPDGGDRDEQGEQRDSCAGVDVLVVSVRFQQLTALKPFISEVASDITVVDTSNYPPVSGQPGPYGASPVEAIDAGQPETAWLQEQWGRHVIRAWNAQFARTLAD
jgi:hypothetical protein